MEVRPLRWQGLAKSRSIQERLESASRIWLQAWRGEERTLGLTLRGTDAEGIDVSLRWFEADTANGRVLLGVREKEFGRVAAALARVPDADAGTIALGIAEQALRDLLRQIASLAGPKIDIRAIESPALDRFKCRHGALAFVCSDPVLEARLYLDEAFCRYLAPVSATPRARLTPRSDALGRQTVTLEVNLPLGSESLAGAQGFQIGQLLVTRTPLNAAIQLTGENKLPLVVGALARDGQARAIRLEGRPNLESRT